MREDVGFSMAFDELERDELRQMEQAGDAVGDMIASLFGLEITLDAAGLEDDGTGV